jgi:hypothetical protein
VGSYYLSYLRIGLLVLLVHDASDIGVDMLKLSNYTKMRDRRGWYIVEVRTLAALLWSADSA